MNIVAVITGDVIASTEIKGETHTAMIRCLKAATEDAVHFMEDFKPSIFQGDSFQGYSANYPSLALREALQIIMKMLANDFGIRLSIGLGNMSYDGESSNVNDGTAFRLSGRNLENLKKEDLLIAVAFDDEIKNPEWQVHSETLNYLLKRCSNLQAEAISEMLHGKTQVEAAEILQIKQPAVQQRLQAAAWPLMQTILNRFESQF